MCHLRCSHCQQYPVLWGIITESGEIWWEVWALLGLSQVVRKATVLHEWYSIIHDQRVKWKCTLECGGLIYSLNNTYITYSSRCIIGAQSSINNCFFSHILLTQYSALIVLFYYECWRVILNFVMHYSPMEHSTK